MATDVLVIIPIAIFFIALFVALRTGRENRHVCPMPKWGVLEHGQRRLLSGALIKITLQRATCPVCGKVTIREIH